MEPLITTRSRKSPLRSYRVYDLNKQTSDSDCSRLRDAVLRLDGVEDVVVVADRGEIGISSAQIDRCPGRDAIAAAVAGAGFVLRGRADRWSG